MTHPLFCQPTPTVLYDQSLTCKCNQFIPFTSMCANFQYVSKDSQTTDTCPCLPDCQQSYILYISQIAKFLYVILSPLVQQQSTHVKDSNNAINIFSTFCFQGEPFLLFSTDVGSFHLFSVPAIWKR